MKSFAWIDLVRARDYTLNVEVLPSLAFLKPDCLWNPTTALCLLGSFNTHPWTGKKFGNTRKVVFQILKFLWGRHWFGPKASGLLWWVLVEGSQVGTSVQETCSKDTEVRTSTGGLQTLGNRVDRAQYWGLEQQLGGCPTKKSSQLDSIWKYGYKMSENFTYSACLQYPVSKSRLCLLTSPLRQNGVNGSVETRCRVPPPCPCGSPTIDQRSQALLSRFSTSQILALPDASAI